MQEYWIGIAEQISFGRLSSESDIMFFKHAVACRL